MVATRFAVAVHILLLLAIEQSGQATSARIAASVNTNPVVIRRIAGRLARAGLVRVRRGPGGAELAKPPESVTLGEIWRAIHPADTPLLSMHRPNPEDPIGRRIPDLIGPAFRAAEQALTDSLANTTLASLLESAGARR
jgi:DNA-binding IscR family transcriptional regulator